METFKEKFDRILIDKLGITQEQIKPKARFKEDLGADSLDVVELVVMYEKEFNITVPDEAIDKIETVADAAFYVLNVIPMRKVSAG